jgi:AcrR family transcriptional regulator
LPNLDLVPARRRFTGLTNEQRRRERRNLLLDAAFDLLGAADGQGMTVRSLLERARLNPRYFYESFGDLDELTVAVYDRVVEELGVAVWAALGDARADPAEHMRAVVDCIVGFVDDDRRRGRVLYVAGIGNETLNRRRVETAGMVLAFVEDYAAAARPEGQAAREVGRVATSVLVGGFNQLLVDWLSGLVSVTGDRLIEDATALFLALGDGVAALAAAQAPR